MSSHNPLLWNYIDVFCNMITDYSSTAPLSTRYNLFSFHLVISTEICVFMRSLPQSCKSRMVIESKIWNI